MDLKRLSLDGYNILNVNGNKQPVCRNGNKLSNWTTLTQSVLAEGTDFNSSMFGIRCGQQGNDTYILSLDFDCCKKKDNNYVDCVDTQQLANNYKNITNEDGMFRSATQGNMNVLIDYTNTTILKDRLIKLNSNKYVRKNSNLEVLIGGLQVLPPTKTKCKRTNELVERKFLTDTHFKVVEDGDEVCKFILDYISVEKHITDENGLTDFSKVLDVNITSDVLLDMIKENYWDDYDVWRKLIWSMKNEGYDIEIGKHYSKKSKKYTENSFISTWNAKDVSKMSIGTIKYYAKLSNRELYFNYKCDEIFKSNKLMEFTTQRTDKSYADIAEQLIGDDIVYTDQKLMYVFMGGFWKQNEDGVMKLLQQSIITLCDRHTTYLLKKRKEKLDDEEFVKQIGEQLKVVAKASNAIAQHNKIKSVLEQLKVNMVDKQNNIVFDTLTPHIFCFKNIAFNLKTRQQYKIKKEDYISMNCGYDYIPPTPEQREMIESLFNSIFENQEIRKTYISILRSGLSGVRQEKFFMATGCGRNGKGLINELMMDVCGSDKGNYGQKLNINVLIQPLKSGPNTEVNNLHHKRWSVSNEPNDNESILAGNVKRLTGDDIIDARPLYSSVGKTNLDHTLLIELNKMIPLNGQQDIAIIERMVCIPFDSYFTQNEDELKMNTIAKRGNSDFKEPAFRLAHKCAMFDYLLASPDELYLCKEVKDKSKEYLLDNNDFYSWFLDVCEKKDNPSIKDFVSIKKLYGLFKQGDFYNNMSKLYKRKSCIRSFLQEHILDNGEMRKYYHPEYAKYEDKIRVIKEYKVLVGWVIKSKQLCGIDSDDEIFDNES